ncbi:MAG: hypothetical protein AB7N80_09620 [Bdellovibrionales bacterium]
MRHVFGRILTVALCVGCTNAQPQFTNVSKALPQPLYFGRTDHTITIVSTVTPIPVSGTCDSGVQRLEFRIDGFQGWGQAANFAAGVATVDCAGTGAFSFDLPSLTTMAVWNTAQTVRFTMLVRGVYAAGDSDTSSLNVEYIVPTVVKPGDFRLSSGTAKASSSNLRARASVGFLSGPKATSTNMKINRQTR